MCSRYRFSASQSPALARFCAQHGLIDETILTPGCRAPVWISGDRQPILRAMRWGFAHPSGLVFNARAESVEEKKMFQACFAQRRCIVPANAYQEWDELHRAYQIDLADAMPFYFAGLWRPEQDDCGFCILTTAPNPSVKAIHDRMPLILTRQQALAWLSSLQSAQALLPTVPPAMQPRCLDGQLSLF